MENELAEFKEAYNELQHVREGFTLHKQRWYGWNYWAQHQQKEFSFGRWMAENNLEYEDVIGSKTNYPNLDITRTRDEGYKYYSAWRGAQTAVEHAEQKFDTIFKELYPKYSNEQLGEAIGKTAEELRKFAAKKSWYKPRNKKRISNEAV